MSDEKDKDKAKGKGDDAEGRIARLERAVGSQGINIHNFDDAEQAEAYAQQLADEQAEAEEQAAKAAEEAEAAEADAVEQEAADAGKKQPAGKGN